MSRSSEAQICSSPDAPAVIDAPKHMCGVTAAASARRDPGVQGLNVAETISTVQASAWSLWGANASDVSVLAAVTGLMIAERLLHGFVCLSSDSSLFIDYVLCMYMLVCPIVWSALGMVGLVGLLHFHGQAVSMRSVD